MLVEVLHSDFEPFAVSFLFYCQCSWLKLRIFFRIFLLVTCVILNTRRLLENAYNFVGERVRLHSDWFKEGMPSSWHKMGYETKRYWTYWSDGKVGFYTEIYFPFNLWLGCRLLWPIVSWGLGFFLNVLSFLIVQLCMLNLPWYFNKLSPWFCIAKGRSQTKYQIVLTKTDVVFPIDVARRAMQIEEVNITKNLFLCIEMFFLALSRTKTGDCISILQSLKEKKSAVQPVVLSS